MLQSMVVQDPIRGHISHDHDGMLCQSLLISLYFSHHLHLPWTDIYPLLHVTTAIIPHPPMDSVCKIYQDGL